MGETKSPARRLASQGGIYAIGNVLIKLSGLLLAPFYLDTSILTRAEYGRFALLDVTGSLSVLLFGMGIAFALIKYMSEEKGGDKSSIPFTALTISLVNGIAAVVVFVLLSRQLSGWLLSTPDSARLIRLYGIYVGLQVALLLPYGYVRFREQASLYVVGRVLEIALLVVGVYYFLGKMRLGLEGIILAYLISSAVAFLVLVGGMLYSIDWKWSGSSARILLAYGLPVAVGLIAAPLLHAGDRYLIEWVLGEEPLSRYFWATRLSGVLNMFVIQSFGLAFSVIGIKSLSRTTVDVSLHRRSFRHFMIWGAWMVLALSLFAPNVTAILTDESVYVSASSLVFPLGVGYLFYGTYLIVVNALYAVGRTRIIGFTVVGATLLNAVLNVVLLKAIGLQGAALATIAAYFALFALTVVVARQDFEINYSFRTMTVTIVIAVVLYAVDQYFVVTESQLWYEHLWVRMGLLLLYPVAVVGFRLYRISEIKIGVDTVAKIIKSR